MLALANSGTLEVWRISVAATPITMLSTLLSEDESERAARFVFDRDRNQFIAVRGRLRQLLGRYLDRPPRDIDFWLGPRGKPILAGGGDLHFNVSHSGDVGLLAFRRGGAIGVDVEQVNARVAIEELAGSCFSSAERSAMRQLDDHARIDRFFQLWAAKEAYIKALGGGLSVPLQEFTVDVRSDALRWSVATFARPGELPWSVMPVPVAAGYFGAVAARGIEWRVDIGDLSPIEHLI